MNKACIVWISWGLIVVAYISYFLAKVFAQSCVELTHQPRICAKIGGVNLRSACWLNDLASCKFLVLRFKIEIISKNYFEQATKEALVDDDRLTFKETRLRMCTKYQNIYEQYILQ